MLPRPGPMNDWPVARSYSQPCQGQAISGGPESRCTSPGPPDTARGAKSPRQSGPHWCGHRLRIA